MATKALRVIAEAGADRSWFANTLGQSGSGREVDTGKDKAVDWSSKDHRTPCVPSSWQCNILIQIIEAHLGVYVI